MTDPIVARLAVGAYACALVAVGIGDIAGFARLMAVAMALAVEAMVRLRETEA